LLQNCSFVSEILRPDDAAARERRRIGELVVDGLKVWAIEPPEQMNPDTSGGLYLTADGRLDEAPTKLGKTLSRRVAPGGVSWFLFFSNLNVFAYLVGERAEFRWL
jgi:hypothetical protein